MPDTDVRAARLNMGKAPPEPGVDHRRLFRRDLFGGLRPAFDELPLQFALFGQQSPVARCTPHLVADGGESAFGAVNGVWSSRQTESLVARPLVPVHEIPNRVVFGFDGRTPRATVVVQGEERCSAARSATPGQRAQPLVRDQVEQCRGRHQMVA